jgi:RNA polymerase sigma factor (sigma-70 family)
VRASAGDPRCSAGLRAVSPAPKMLSFLSHYVRMGRVLDLEECLRESPLARAAINALGSDGTTLLGSAARRGDAACCRVLLEHGAAPGGVPGQGRAPLDLAEEAGNPEVVALIERALRPAPPPPAEPPALRELEFDFAPGFDLGPIEEEAPVVVHAPPPAVWAGLRQQSERINHSAPVEADLELALEDFSFEVPDELRIKGLSQEVAERLRSVVTASLVEGRVRRAALAEALDVPGSEGDEDRAAALIDALAARIAQAGALDADDVWEAADPLVIERPTEPRWDGGLRAGRGSPAAGAFELPELFVDPLHDAGVGLPVVEVLAVVDELGADAEAAWWAKAARARTRPMSGPEDVLHERLALAQEQLVVDVGRWLDALPPHERAAVRDALLAGGTELDGAEVEGAIHPDTAHPEPPVDGIATPSDEIGGAELGEEDEATEGLEEPASAPAGVHRDGSRAKGRLPRPLGRNTMQVWLPRLRLLGAPGPAGHRSPLPGALLDAAARILGLMVELTEHHLPLVQFIVNDWRWSAVDVDDLIQQGNLGLWRALYTFEPEKGGFSTYAHWWILARITRYIQVDGDLHSTSSLAGRAEMYEEALDWRRLSQPAAGWTDVAAWFGDKVERVKTTVELKALVQGRCSWEELDEEVQPRAHALDPAGALATQADAVALRRALVQLEPREQEVLGLRFGLGGEDGAKLSAIGLALHLSRERVRQIETKALERLRSLIEGRAEEAPKPGRRPKRAERAPRAAATTSEDPPLAVDASNLNPPGVPTGPGPAAQPDRQRRDDHVR